MLWPFARFKIQGNSMVPLYRSGDHVLLWRWGKIREGDFIVFQKNGMKMIKRALRKTGDGWEVKAENFSEGDDSSEFGAVSFRNILGKVIFKY